MTKLRFILLLALTVVAFMGCTGGDTTTETPSSTTTLTTVASSTTATTVPTETTATTETTTEEEQNNITFTSVPQDVTLTSNETVDLTSYLSLVTATTVTEGNPTITYSISEVSLDGVAFVPTDLTSVDLQTQGTYEITITATDGTASNSASFNIVQPLKNIGSFEDGTDGWTNATVADLSSETDFFSSDTQYQNTDGETYLLTQKVGDYYLTTDNPESRLVTFTSPSFTVYEDSWITFALNSGKQADVTYLALIDADTQEELEVFSNYGFNDPSTALTFLHQYYPMDKYAGRNVALKLVDASDSDFGHIGIDDVWVNLSFESVSSMFTAQKAWAAAYEVWGTPQNETSANKIFATVQNYYANLELIRISNLVADTTFEATDNVDLTTYLTGVTTFDSANYSTTVAITAVNGDTTGDFADYDLSVAGTYVITYTISSIEGISYERTFDIIVTEGIPIDVINGSFEDGITGWTGITEADLNTDTIYWGGQSQWSNEEGDYYQLFLQTGATFVYSTNPESRTLTLTSSKFEVLADTYISFKLGGAKNPESVYVALIDADTNEVLEVFANYDWSDPNTAQTLLTYYYPVGAYAGRVVRIQVVDNADSDFGFFCFDDLKVNLTRAQAQALLNADKAWAAAYVPWGTPVNATAAESLFTAIQNHYANLELYLVDGLPGNTLVDASDSVDLTAYLTGITTYNQDDYPMTISIISVKYNDDAAVTDGTFNAYDLSAAGTYLVTYTIADGKGFQLVKSFTLTVSGLSNQVYNGGFETGDLTGWTLTFTDGTTGDPSLAISDATTYWGEQISFNKSGTYFFSGGEYEGYGLPESAKYTLRSSNFLLSGSGYISFKLAGNGAIVNVYLADGTLIASYMNTAFSDTNFPHVEEGCILATMTTFYADLSPYIGQEMYIELVDNRDSGWGITVFDELITYITETDMQYYFDNPTEMADPIICVNHETPVTYDLPWKEAISMIALNGGFETGTLDGWTLTFTNDTTGDPSLAISDATTFWGEQISFNKSGTYFFSGGEYEGYGLPESAMYTLRSSNFVLGGSGYIMYKVAGNGATVNVYLADGTLIASYDNTAFSDTNFPHVEEGCVLATMTTFLADLSAYLGQEMYVVLIDDSNSGWGITVFDELVTYISSDQIDYYNNNPSEMADTIICVNHETPVTYELAWETAVNTVS